MTSMSVESKSMGARQRACRHLLALLERGQSLSHTLTTKDDPFTKELCFGVSRHYHRLSALLDKLVEKRPKELMVWVCLLMGLYELHVLKKPAYATVNEAVTLLDNTRYSFAKGFVNAVLRRYCREQADYTQVEKSEAVWLQALLEQDWPTFCQDIIEANDQHPPMTLRVNLAKIDRESYLASLEKEGIVASTHPYVPSAIVLAKPVNVHELPGFLEGEVSVQDVSAQAAVTLLGLEKHSRVLDACAAPGGKTCHLLEREPSLDMIALDKDEKRLQRLMDNLNRLNLKATVTTGDGTSLSSWWDGDEFDLILLDAPCSATGVIRRHPDIRVLRQAGDLVQLTLVQSQLLRTLWPTLKVGGQLLYVTCSVLRQENDAQITSFLKEEATAQHVKLRLPWGRAMAHGWQCLPGEAKGDGFYYALLEKV